MNSVGGQVIVYRDIMAHLGIKPVFDMPAGYGGNFPLGSYDSR